MKKRLSSLLRLPLAVATLLSCMLPAFALEKTVTVTSAGALSTLIPESEKMTITKLKINGPLNGTDILFIREMAGRNQWGSETEGKLTDLDISGANIVAGGQSYCYSSNFTEDNVVGPNMFGELGKIQKIALPQNIIRLDLCAFYRCYELESVNIPAEVRTIVSNAFFNCKKLKSVTIPEKVEKIDEAVFSGCTSMTEINVSPANKHYKSLEGVLYNFACDTLMAFPSGIKGAYTIPTGPKAIAPAAFNEASIEKVVISEDVKFIGDAAFSNNSNLKSITFPNSLEFIDTECFIWCDNLTEIIWGNSLKELADGVFCRCYGLTEVTLPASLQKMGNSVFSNCQTLTKVNLGAGLKEMGNNVFISCKKLSQINVDSKNEIFRGIDGVLFDNGGSRLLVFPEGKGGAYEVPETTTEIADEAFLNCKLLTSVTIPDNVKKIGTGAFSGCEELTAANLGKGITEIPEYLFENCDYLESVSFGDINSIGGFAFSSCSALKKIVFPATLKEIANDAFSFCKGLTEIDAYGIEPPKCGKASDVFYQVTTGDIKMYVPKQSLAAYQANETWNKFKLEAREDAGIDDVKSDFTEHVVNIYNLSGKCVFTGRGSEIPVLDKGIYIVKDLTEGETVKKAF